MISVVIKYWFLIMPMSFFIGCASHPPVQQSAESGDKLTLIFSHARDLVENHAYEEAAQVYVQFLDQYPRHIFADDAAYRLAYLHVVADPVNPLYDYEKASLLFQKFIETYENSRYINACTNWLAVLQPRRGQNSPGLSDKADVMQLKQQISDLRSENKKLRMTLAELQEAIER